MESKFTKRSQNYLQPGNFVELRQSKQIQSLKRKKKSRQTYLNDHRKQLKQLQDELISNITLPLAFNLIFSDSLKDKTLGARYLRLFLNQNYSYPLQELIDSGVIPILIDFTTQFTCPELQYESAWSLSNIASGDVEHTKILVDKGIVPKIVDLLNSPFEHIKDQALWVIGNITGDTSSYSELICRYDTVQKIIKIIQTCTSDDLLKSAVWALGNLCKGEKAPEFRVIKDAVSVFCALLAKTDEDIVKTSLWVLASITEYSEGSCDLIIECKVLNTIISLFANKDIDVQLPAISIIGRVAAGSDSQTSEVISSGAITALTPLINSPNREIRKDAIWCLSNLAAGNEEHIEALVKAEIFQKINKILYRDEKYVKVEALWVIANVAGKGNRKQINELVKAGAISTLIHCLSSEDYKELQVVLLGIKGILNAGNQILTESGANPYAVIFEESDGIKLLDKLQYKENTKLYEDSYYILTTFFDAESADQDLIDMIEIGYNMESNLFGKDKKPANYFYGISKPTRYSPSRCRTLQNKNFCINGLPAFTSNYTDPSQSTQLSKLASKLAKIRQFKIKGQSHKTDSRKNEFATVHKLNLQTRKTCNQSSALGQETADRSSPTILSSRAPLIIKCNDWTSIAGQVFQIPSSLKIHSISSKKLVRSMTPS